MKKAEVPLEVCPTCGATMKLVTGPVEHTVNSSVVLVSEHAYLLCSTCGEKLFNLSQLGAAARGIHRSERDLLEPMER